MLNSQVIAFIGAGKMATAIAGGMVKNGFKPENIRAFDVSHKAATHFAKQTGAATAASLEEAVKGATVVVLAVKPQYLHDAVAESSGMLSDKLLISILAGVKISSLYEITKCERIIRVMPNTPALICEGFAAYSYSANTSESDRNIVEHIFNSVGQCSHVQEKLMDAVTGLSGSGPAFVFEFIQALCDSGVYLGLPRDMAIKMAAQTVLGSAKMVIETGEHPCLLRDQVTSPGGTTIRGINALEQASFRGTVINAVVAAANRSTELGQDKK